MKNQPNATASHRARNIVLAFAVLASAGYGAWHYLGSNGEGTRQATYENLTQEEFNERAALYTEAAQKGKELIPDWPANEQELFTQFWTAIANHDMERALVLCPGAKADDFAMFGKFTPKPPTAIGRPEPHPQHADIPLWPVTVPFPGYPNKTVKMAVARMDDGRIAVNGQHTIWW